MAFRTSYNNGLKQPPPDDPNVNPYEGEANRLSTLGRELTPEEEEIIRMANEWKPTGGFPIGGSIGPMPSSPMPRGGSMGALDTRNPYLTRGETAGPQYAGNPDELTVDPYTLQPIRR